VMLARYLSWIATSLSLLAMTLKSGLNP
jgi:hypothetical protein